MEFNLNKILKALLFSTAEPLTVRDIQRVITRFHEEAEKCQLEFKQMHPQSESAEVPEPIESADTSQQNQFYSANFITQVPSLLTASQIREAIDQVDQELEQNQDVYRVQTTANGFRIVVVPEFSEWVRLLRNAPKPTKLRSSALETLAIIAYRQPTTRAEMEAIRGVSVDSALNKLIELELITVVGRADAPGRPIQYGTTDKFLEFCGLGSLSDLPASDALSPSQLNDLIARATNPVTPQDSDVGLASPEGEDEEASSDEANHEHIHVAVSDQQSDEDNDVESASNWDEDSEDENEEAEESDDEESDDFDSGEDDMFDDDSDEDDEDESKNALSLGLTGYIK